MVYAYLYSREMLDANSLRMTPIWHEDEEFTPRALYYARRIQYLPVRVYNYLQRSDSFMGNYKPQSRLDLVRAMKSLTCFASRIGAEDPSGARLMRLHVGKTMSLACKQTVVRQLGNAREMLREARRQGIMPLEFRRRDFRHFPDKPPAGPVRSLLQVTQKAEIGGRANYHPESFVRRRGASGI